MGTISAPSFADLFYCFKKGPSCCLSNENEADVVEAFNSTSGYLDEEIMIMFILKNKTMVVQLYQIELRLN